MMLWIDDEDATLKIPPVRPNDVIGIDISSGSNILNVTTKCGLDPLRDNQSSSPRKAKLSKGKLSRASLYQPKKFQTKSMSKGDPFLPSVISDESPFADYPVKNSRKKPSDCKCKGLGYNLSPSALLPDEMRQQWGAGVFGKPSTPNSRNSAGAGVQPFSYSLTLYKGECDKAKCVNTCRCDHTINNQVHVSPPAPVLSPAIPSVRPPSDIMICQSCFQNPCSCSELPQQGFRMPSKNEGRKIKTSLKTPLLKSRDNILATATPTLRKFPCYDCKENSNIISTANFNKNSTSTSTIAMDRSYVSPSYDSGYFKAGFSCGQRSNRMSYSQGYDPGEFSDMTKDTLTPKVRHHHLAKPPRRVLTDITNISNSDPSASTNMYHEKTKILPRTHSSQMVLVGNRNQSCSCESCRPVRSFLSRTDSMDFTQNQTHPIVQPVGLGIPNYKSSSMTLSQKRYQPYSTNPYSYSHNSRPVYQSSDMYSCPSPEFEYDGQRYQLPQASSTPLALAHDMNEIEASLSFLDNDLLSPASNSPEETKDITEMSIKDTVDFFVNMKSPFVSATTSIEETFGGIDGITPNYSPSYSFDDDLPSPCQQMRTACFCSLPNCPGTVHGHHQPGEATFQFPDQLAPFPQPPQLQSHPPQPPQLQSHPPQPQLIQPKMNRSNNNKRSQNFQIDSSRPLPPQSMSLLYSSLVSDLEDELRSAVENIPTD